MADVGVSVLEESAPSGECRDDLLAHQHCPDRLIAAAKPFGDRHQIRRDALLLDRMQRASAAHPAHDFVGDEEDNVPVADLADAAEVAGYRRQCAGGRAADGLGAEGDHVLAAQAPDRIFELAGEARTVRFGRFAGAPVAILVARRDVFHVDQERRELSPPPLVPADRERAERIAVITLPPRDEVPPLRLADLDEVLPRELERRLDRLRAAGDEIDVRHARRRARDQLIGKLLGHGRREEAGMRIGDPVDLLVHRPQDVGMTVAEARHRRAAGRVNVFPARGVDDANAVSARREWQSVAQTAMKDVTHVGALWTALRGG